MILKDWELRTIEALAREAFERESDKTEIRHPDLWLDKAIRDRQADAMSSERYRLQLVKHAERLGIGNPVLAHVTADDPLGYEVAPQSIANRWQRIIRLVLTVDTTHEWRDLHRELVTTPLMNGRMNKGGWHVEDDGLGVLEILEIEAKRHGLINDEPAPHVDTRTLAQRLLESLGRVA